MMAAIENNPVYKRFPVRKIGWSILVGIGGNVLVFLFLTTFLNFYVALKFIPWIIVFNCAVSGYALVDRTRHLIRRKKLLAALMGAAIAVVTCGLLVMLSFYFVAENFMQIHDAAFFLVIAVIGSWLGAVLGIKYYKLDNSGKS